MSLLKVLYVDDDELVREVAVMALELDPGMEVKAFAGGAAALAFLGADDWRPELLLLDVMMPQMDGPTLLGELRRRRELEDTPAIFVTARAQAAEHEALLAAGALGILTKPFDPMTLAEELRRRIAGG